MKQSNLELSIDGWMKHYCSLRAIVQSSFRQRYSDRPWFQIQQAKTPSSAKILARIVPPYVRYRTKERSERAIFNPT